MLVITTSLLISMVCLAGARKFSSAIPSISYVFLFISWVVPTLIIGMRSYNVGVDSGIYAANFESFNPCELTFKDYLSPGYTLLSLVLWLFNIHQYQFLFLLISALTFAFLINAIWKQSKNPGMTFFFFLCYGNVLESANQYRQFLSVSIVLYAFNYLNKYGSSNHKFCLLVLLACSFHPTAFVCLLIPFFEKLAISSFWMLMSVIFSIPLFNSISFIFRKVMNYIPYVQDYVGSVFDTSTSSEGVLAFAFRFVIFFLLCASLKREDGYDAEGKKLLKTSFYGLILQSLALSLPVLARLPFYGIQATAILIPRYLEISYNRSKTTAYLKWLVLVVLFSTYFAILFFEKNYQLTIYSFFWQ